MHKEKMYEETENSGQLLNTQEKNEKQKQNQGELQKFHSQTF